MADDLKAFLALVSAMNPRTVPPADVEDMIQGANYIPGRVTELRRGGQIVRYDPKNNEWDYKGEIIR